ncbi:MULTISPECIES: hypothetical protein [unclassified Microcoleus]|uniref:hypothetical protein n=1 Tax=unclassified Microcoleus TaxID=2642155 RepID=UPI002FCEAB9B
MSILQRREYKGFDVDFEQLSLESYCGKVYYRVIVAANILSDQLTDYAAIQIKNPDREYKTKPYSTPEEVFIHLMGWVDCKLYYDEYNNIPEDDEDSYQNKYNELLKKLENKRFEEDVKKSQTTKDKRESAYQEGWTSKIEELNNMQVINPE